MTTGEILAQQIDGTRDWTLKLLAEFSGQDWHYQPAPGLGHALWLCGHLAVAQNLLIHMRCLGGESVIEAEFGDHFPIGETVKSADEYDYPQPEYVLRLMADTHAKTLAAIRGMSDEQLAQPAFGKDGSVHPHYTDKLGAVSHCMRHEAFHAGQIATIRRMLGKTFLR